MTHQVNITVEDFRPNPDYGVVILRPIPGGRELHIKINGEQASIDLNDIEFSNLADDMTQAASDLVLSIRNKAVTRLTWTPSIFHASKGLGSAGHSTWNKLFAPNNFLNSRKTKIFIQSDEDINLPWGFLYEQDPAQAITQQAVDNLKFFWAKGGIVTRLPINHSRKQQSIPKETDTLKVGIIIENNLIYAQSEQKRLVDLAQVLQGNVKIDIFEDKYNSDWEFIKALNTYLCKDFDIIHFACHGEANRNGLRSLLVLGNQREYLLRNLDNNPRVNFSAPLIFLNACSTGIRDAAQTYNFIKEFHKHGARNVIAIESSVHSILAEQFSLAFYSQIFNGSTLGDAMYDTKNHLLLNGQLTEDIYALFYSLYANPDFKFIIK